MSHNKTMGRAWIKEAVKLAVGVLLLTAIFYKVDVGKIASALQQIDYRYCCLGLLFFCAMGLMESGRIYVALRGYRLSLSRSVGLFLTGTFFSNFVPGQFGSEIYKILYLNKIEPGLKKPITLMVMLRMAGLGTLILMAVLYSAVNHRHIASVFGKNFEILDTIDAGNVVLVAVSLILLGLLAALLIGRGMPEGFRQRLNDYHKTLSGLSIHQYVYVAGFSALVVLLRVCSFYFFTRSLGENIFVLDLIVVVGLVQLANLVPISFASLGVREGAITLGLSLFGVSRPSAAAVAVITRGILWLFSIIGGILFLATKKAGSDSDARTS